MITKEELQQLLMSTETFRVERTVSTNNMDKSPMISLIPGKMVISFLERMMMVLYQGSK